MLCDNDEIISLVSCTNKCRHQDDNNKQSKQANNQAKISLPVKILSTMMHQKQLPNSMLPLCVHITAKN